MLLRRRRHSALVLILQTIAAIGLFILGVYVLERTTDRVPYLNEQRSVYVGPGR